MRTSLDIVSSLEAWSLMAMWPGSVARESVHPVEFLLGGYAGRWWCGNNRHQRGEGQQVGSTVLRCALGTGWWIEIKTRLGSWEVNATTMEASLL